MGSGHWMKPFSSQTSLFLAVISLTLSSLACSLGLDLCEAALWQCLLLLNNKYRYINNAHQGLGSSMSNLNLHLKWLRSYRYIWTPMSVHCMISSACQTIIWDPFRFWLQSGKQFKLCSLNTCIIQAGRSKHPALGHVFIGRCWFHSGKHPPIVNRKNE